jgi:hypothetical protein
LSLTPSDYLNDLLISPHEEIAIKVEPVASTSSTAFSDSLVETDILMSKKVFAYIKGSLQDFYKLLELETDDPRCKFNDPIEYLKALELHEIFAGRESINALGQLFNCEVTIYGISGALLYHFMPKIKYQDLHFLLDKEHYEFIDKISDELDNDDLHHPEVPEPPTPCRIKLPIPAQNSGKIFEKNATKKDL